MASNHSRKDARDGSHSSRRPRERARGEPMCDTCRQPGPVPINTKICSACQPWDEVDHLLRCEQYHKVPKFAFPHPTAERALESAVISQPSFANYLRVYEICFRKPQLTLPRSKHVWFAERNKGISLLLGVYYVDPNNQIYYRLLTLTFLVRYENDGRRALQEIRCLDRKCFDTGIVDRMLRSCQEAHGKDCNSPIRPMTLPRGFRVIDTSEWSITQRSDITEYVALSYVWASTSSPSGAPLQLLQSNLDRLSRPGSLHTTELPGLLSDAIQFCSDVGQKYLWIDRLCIIQDEKEMKAEQIDAMDVIYHMATFTIVALGSQMGLQGTSRRPRSARLDIDYKSSYRDSCITFDGLENALKVAEWTKRGWTYQEQLLSRRCIFFCDNYMYFNCATHTLRDDGTKVELFGVEDLLNGLQVYRNVPTFHHFKTTARQYSLRTLTFHSDALNAFAGVANIVGSRLGTRMLFGLPERFFLQSLMWTYLGTSGTRRGISCTPSWSWLAWDGEVTWDHENIWGGRTWGAMSKLFKLIPIGLVDGEGSIRVIDEEEGDSILQKGDNTGSPTHSPWPSWWWHNSLGMAPQHISDHEVLGAANAHPGCLVFSTTCARLRLPQNTGGETVGETMPMNSRWAPSAAKASREHDFIVLGAGLKEKVTEWNDFAYWVPKETGELTACGGEDLTGYSDEYDQWEWDERDWRRNIPICELWYDERIPNARYVFYVMMVETGHDLISRRLAVGLVDPVAWREKCNPVWKTVVLG
ncbi:hypothetical protein PG993_005955 [Apiospora rasikravindrae]|uniref:Heterokaryon incompatibility domain-containing protein n=1 Tax=Apiospora rasikravindrae TaxID=990691 RepID=A0ABR1TA94_9PEZI